MSDSKKDLSQKSSSAAIDAFVKKVRSTPVVKSGQQRGRLMFAMDATASREPSWDRACRIQGEMFSETAALGGLDIQLCYYRGYGEFEASPWLSSADALLQRMTSVSCRGGYTQIEKVLLQAIEQTRQKKVQALVFVGDRDGPERLFVVGPDGRQPVRVTDLDDGAGFGGPITAATR